MRATGVALAAGLLGLAGCGGSIDTLSVPSPPAVTVPAPPPPDTFPPNLASESEPTPDGVTTTTAIAMGPGNASINGTVLGPNGPVPGATVEIDRFVGEQYTSVTTTAAADGSFLVSAILGGRMRVRAWQAPTLTMATPQVIFVAAAQRTTVSLQLSFYQGPTVAYAINPPSPIVNEPTNLVVQVTNPTVGTDGVLRNPPVRGVPVTLVEGPEWLVSGSTTQNTDSDGETHFQVSCGAVGEDPLSAQVGTSAPVALQVPPCSAPPSTPVPTEPPTTTTPGSTTTSTSCPQAPSTTQPGGLLSPSTTTFNYGNSC